MFENLKSHAANMGLLVLAWFSFISVVSMFAVIAYAVITLIKALDGSFWVYFGIASGIIFIPPIILWSVWLRKHS